MTEDSLWLKNIVENHFFSTADAAHKIKVSRQYLYGIKNGMYPLSPRVRALLLNAARIKKEKFFCSLINNKFLTKEETRAYLLEKFNRSISDSHFCTLVRTGVIKGKKISRNGHSQWLVESESLQQFKFKKNYFTLQ
jgi:hypothetical protein